MNNNSVFVATENGTLIIHDVFDDNGAGMINQLNIGDRFFTPAEYLEKAKQTRVKYSPLGIQISKCK